MTKAEFATTFPTLYHMAHEDAWPSIRRHGLLSTSALLDLFKVDGDRRAEIETRHRPESVLLSDAEYGTAVVRDQKPMSDAALRTCLTNMQPADWYKVLNERVFFWVERDRLLRLLSARAYRSHRHCVLTIDTARLLERCGDRVTLSPINSGSTIFNPQPRGHDTFHPISAYPFDRWTRKRGSVKKAVVELAVGHSVPKMEDLVLRVEIMHRGEVLNRLLP